jgi:hypothetical protein
MTEHITIKPEQLPAPEHMEALPTPEQAEPLRKDEAAPSLNIEQARETADLLAPRDNPVERLQAAEKAQEPSQQLHINEELEGITLRRELKHMQRQLPAPERALSSAIHQPLIRAVSDAASKTVSRPSGLLGGGIVAFVGTSAYLYFTKHIGVQYNYLIFVLLFVGGFAVGLILELIIWTLARRHRSTHE